MMKSKDQPNIQKETLGVAFAVGVVVASLGLSVKEAANDLYSGYQSVFKSQGNQPSP